MAVVTPTGNKVVWGSLERVDYEDMVAMADLPLRAVAAQSGALVGNLGDHSSDGGFATPGTTRRNGLMSKLTYDTSDWTQVTFSPFTAGFALESSAGEDDEGAVNWLATFVYDLSTAFGGSGSTPSLDFSGHAGQTPYVWARRVQLPADAGNRREWDDENDQEILSSMNTRTRERVDLGLSNYGAPEEPPDADPDNSWVKIARASSVAVDAVVLEPRYLLDKYDAVMEASAANVLYGKGAKFYAVNRSTSDGPGLAEVVTATFATLAKIFDGRWEIDPETFTITGGLVSDLVAWYANLSNGAFRGLSQLDDAIDANGQDIVAHNTRLTTIETVVPLHTIVFKWNAGTSQYDILGQTPNTFAASVSDTVEGAGPKAQILYTVPSGYVVYGVHVDAPARPFTLLLSGVVTPGPSIYWATDVSLPFVGDGAVVFTLQIIRTLGDTVNDDHPIIVTLTGTRS
jgi:hypothetical protein